MACGEDPLRCTEADLFGRWQIDTFRQDYEKIPGPFCGNQRCPQRTAFAEGVRLGPKDDMPHPCAHWGLPQSATGSRCN